MWRVCKEAGRPWPVIVPEDDVLDYMVMEAVAIKVRQEEKKAAKEAEKAEWKKKTQEELKKYT
jgi:hypothetical protein